MRPIVFLCFYVSRFTFECYRVFEYNITTFDHIILFFNLRARLRKNISFYLCMIII